MRVPISTGLALVFLTGLILAGCSREPAPGGTAPPPTSSAQGEPADSSGSPESVVIEEYEATLPRVVATNGYAGSESCRSCHQDQFASWHRSYHRTMTQFAAESSVQADFNNVVLTNENTRFILFKKSDQFWVRMEPVNAAAEETSREPVEVRMGLVTGSHHMQVFWVPEGHGNLQIGFPFTWLIPEKKWVPRNSTFIRPPNLAYRSEMWNIVCSRCHTTAIEPRTDVAARRFETQAAELGISCEACHGPGARHVAARNAAPKAAGASGEKAGLPPNEIVHPREIDAVPSGQVCGFCHSMKWIEQSSSWREHGFAYRPGDDLEKTTPVVRPSRVNEIAGLKAYLDKNQDLLRDFFWPDGMIRVSGREYNGLIESPCYKGGKFSCVTCHSLHESDPNDQLAEPARGNKVCLSCHGKFEAPETLAAHTRHGPRSPGSECYNCHMPHTTYGVLKAIRSHQVSSPRVADDLASGRPNACNLCHLDQPLAWAADTLHRWYGQPLTEAAAARTNLAHVVQLALAGDAGQRALAAWHLSWEPALAISGTNWVPPVLGQMLEDPYAAVRLVAERSLRKISPFVPKAFDFAVDPRHRATVREDVWEQWAREHAAPSATRPGAPLVLTHPTSMAERQKVFDQLSWSRDEKPVRLRE